MIAGAQRAHNALATEIAHAAGLRAHALFTLARPEEQPPDRRPTRREKFAGRPGRDYTVAGKGGLIRMVRIPDQLAERLEERRLDEPMRITDRGVTTSRAATSPPAPRGAAASRTLPSGRSAGRAAPMGYATPTPSSACGNCSGFSCAHTPSKSSAGNSATSGRTSPRPIYLEPPDPRAGAAAPPPARLDDERRRQLRARRQPSCRRHC